MTSASFEVEVTPADARAFATLSGDWNPLHTDADYAARTLYKQPILHGAFSAGLVSRMAGMHLPGRDCLLHSMRLRFIAPIRPPATLIVSGRQASSSGEAGRVDVTISDARTGARYVDAVYEFSRHEEHDASVASSRDASASALEQSGSAPVLVTGASGGLGRAVLTRLGPNAVGVSREERPGMLAGDASALAERLGDRRISAIVHCGWPSPDNQRLIALDDSSDAVDHHVGGPLRTIIGLARLLVSHGADNAMLILVGSTAAETGRHNYRAPLYSLAKGMIPDLARVLALELGASGKRCAALVYDVIAGGMNERLSASAKLAHTDRSPSGLLPSPADAAEQVAWLLGNPSFLVSGATITVSGGAIP